MNKKRNFNSETTRLSLASKAKHIDFEGLFRIVKLISNFELKEFNTYF